MNNNKSINKYALIVLFIIFFLGVILRFYQLDKIPPGPEWDEASVGYNAYTISQTGKDEWGNKLPLIFPAFGDYKNPLYIYLTAPIVKFFGLNIVTTRFINALAGSLLVLVWFGIAQLIFKNKYISLLASFFLAVSPFGLFFSRIAGDGIMLSVFLISLGIMLEIYFLKTKKYIAFYGSIITLILSIFSYNLGRIVTPILIFIIFIINFFLVKIKKTVFIFPLILCFLSLFIVIQQSNLSINSRLKYVGIFSNEKGTVLQINELREHDKNNLISKALHNKLTFFLINISSSYISHFSSNFLVNMKSSLLVSESLYPPIQNIMLPFYYTGILLCFRYLFNKANKNRLYIFLIFALFFIAPFPSVITEDAPSSKRNLAQLGCIELFISVGLFWFVQLLSNQKNSMYRYILFLGLFSIYLFSILNFLYSFFIQYPNKFGFIYARKEAKICEEIKKTYDQYDYFIYSRKIDGVPYIFPLFCQQYDPNKFIKSKKYRLIDNWFYIDSYDKFVFYDEIAPTTIDKIFSLRSKKISLFMNKAELINSFPALINYQVIPKDIEVNSINPLITDPNNILYHFSLSIK